MLRGVSPLSLSSTPLRLPSFRNKPSSRMYALKSAQRLSRAVRVEWEDGLTAQFTYVWLKDNGYKRPSLLHLDLHAKPEVCLYFWKLKGVIRSSFRFAFLPTKVQPRDLKTLDIRKAQKQTRVNRRGKGQNSRKTFLCRR